MAISYEAVTSGANPSADSLLIPYGDLDGLTDASELGNSTEEDDAKIASALFLSMQSALASLTNPLGVAQAKPNPTGAGTDLINQNVSLTWSYVSDFVNKAATVYPAAAGSSKTVAFTDVFPNAEIVATAATASADSLALPIADLTAVSADFTVANKQGSLGDDQRDMLEALTRFVYSNSTVRANGTQSGITAKTKGNANGSAAPTDFFTDTTFSQSDSENLAWFSLAYSITFQYLLNQETGQFDVNIA